MSGINALFAPILNAFGGITGVLTVVASVSNFAGGLDSAQARCLDQGASKLSADLVYRSASGSN